MVEHLTWVLLGPVEAQVGIWVEVLSKEGWSGERKDLLGLGMELSLRVVEGSQDAEGEVH